MIEEMVEVTMSLLVHRICRNEDNKKKVTKKKKRAKRIH